MNIANSNLPGSDPFLVSREILNDLGRIQPIFSLAVRSLSSDYYKGCEALSPASMFFVNRLMKSPSMKACVYHSVLTFHSETIANTPYLASADLVRFFRAGDLATVFGIAYYYRTIRKQLVQGPHEDLWNLLSARCQHDADLGGYVGYCMPNISSAVGMFARAIIPLAHAIFLIRFQDKASDYLRAIYQKNQPISFDHETNLFGCSCIHLISNILQQFGFGMPWMNAALSAYSTIDQPLPKQEEKDKIFARLRYSILWIDTLNATGRAPTFKIPADYYPTEKELFKLLYLSNTLKEQGSRCRWLTRGKEDISPSATPQLFQEYLAESAPMDELKNFCSQHIAPDILEEITDGDLMALTLNNQETIDF